MNTTTDNPKPRILPAPRSCEWAGEWFEYGDTVELHEPYPAWLRFETADEGRVPEDPIAAQTYLINIRNDGVTIRSATEVGRRYALHTLEQIMRSCPKRMPTGLIDDAPAFAVRGVMLDISRDRVPTMETLFDTINLLASLKINHLQLYMEHTFAYAGHETVWREASPLTPDDVRQLDEYCAARGIELVANQNCFGHMERWLKHENYTHLAETTGDWDFNGTSRSGPFSLCPSDPGSIKLVRDLLSQLLPCFSSPFVNIGCDETFDVGQGRSRDLVKERGPATMFAEFVSQVASVAREHGKRPMFWADMALKHGECVDQLPEDMIALDWGYEPDSPFDEHGAKLKALGREHWVCPGTSTWRTFTGRSNERNGNLRAAARAGVAHGATGYLVTDWGDLGHRQQWPLTLYGIVEGAHFSWCGDDTNRPFDPRAASQHVFLDPTETIGPWLHALGNADYKLRQNWNIETAAVDHSAATHLLNASALFVDLHEPLTGRAFGSLEHWNTAHHHLLELAEHIPPVKPYSDELQHAINMASFAVGRALARRQPGGITDDKRTALAADLNDLVEDYRRLWHLRSRPGGLEGSCAHYTTVLNNRHPKDPA